MKKYYIKKIISPSEFHDDYLELTEQEVKELVNEYMMNNGGANPTHKRKYFVPKVGEEYWFTVGLMTHWATYEDDYDDKNKMLLGNCFATEQDATDELNRRQALVRIWNNYDDKYHWDIDWENKLQCKHGIGFNHFRGIPNVQASETIYQYQSELPYFKSAEDRNQFVEENRDDLLAIFNIKK